MYICYFHSNNKPTRVVETNAATAGHLYALQNIIAAKSTCVESTQEANKRMERGQRGEGEDSLLSPKIIIINSSKYIVSCFAYLSASFLASLMAYYKCCKLFYTLDNINFDAYLITMFSYLFSTDQTTNFGLATAT